MKLVIFYFIITFSYTKYLVHSYTVDAVFTLSYYDILIHYPDIISLRTCSCSRPVLNRNVAGSIQSRTWTSPVKSSLSNWFRLTHFVILFSYLKSNSSYHLSVYKAWILKIPEHGFSFRPLMIFKTETEMNSTRYVADTWTCSCSPDDYYTPRNSMP